MVNEAGNVSPEVRERASRIKLLLMDCDGVLTDGSLYFDSKGEAMKVFNVRDGQGLALWHRAGFRSGIITGRDAHEILEVRCAELGVHYLRYSSDDKVSDFLEIIAVADVLPEETAYVGDDVGDIALMKVVGLPITVADCAAGVLPHALFRTAARGGRGAIREITDLLLSIRT